MSPQAAADDLAAFLADAAQDTEPLPAPTLSIPEQPAPRTPEEEPAGPLCVRCCAAPGEPYSDGAWCKRCRPSPDSRRYCPPAICYCGGCSLRPLVHTFDGSTRRYGPRQRPTDDAVPPDGPMTRSSRTPSRRR